MSELDSLIRTDVPLSYGASAVYPYSKELENKYRFNGRFGDEVLLHKIVGDTIHLPRALCPVGGEVDLDYGEKVAYTTKPEPRGYQVDTFGKIEDMMLSGKSGIVRADTGWGKTLAGYHAAYVLGVRTLVITTKDDIHKKWLKGAQEFLGLPWDRVGEIQGDKCEVIGTDFVVAMVQSLCRDGRYPDWIGNGFGLVIYDELHRFAAPYFSKVSSMFRARVRLGLSATVERSDGKEMLLYSHIGPVRVVANVGMEVPKVLRYRTNWSCPRVFKEDKGTGKRKIVRLPHQPGKTAHIERMLASDPDRTAMLARIIKSVVDSGRVVAVFSTQVEHLRTMQRAVVKLGVKKKDTGLYIGASTVADRKRRDAALEKGVIFTTFSMMGEGTDAPWVDTALLAMPRSNVVQPVGRIRREHKGKKSTVVIDIIDNDSPVFQGYSQSRKRWYTKIGAEIIDMT